MFRYKVGRRQIVKHCERRHQNPQIIQLSQNWQEIRNKVDWRKYVSHSADWDKFQCNGYAAISQQRPCQTELVDKLTYETGSTCWSFAALGFLGHGMSLLYWLSAM